MEERLTDNNKRGFFYCERIEPMFGQGRRDWSVDVLRCISCFMVCLTHSTRMTVTFEHGVAIADNMWLHNEIYAMLAASPTVLFVMVSGIFFLSPERNVRAGKVWRKNVIKMAFAYIFWCGIYACYDIYLMNPQPEITLKYFVNCWMQEPLHLWYIPMIIGLYIICPILRPITATSDRKLFKYIIAIFIGGLILWTIYYWPTHPEEGGYAVPIIDKTPMSLVCQYPFWMLFGWIAYSYRPGRGFRYLIYLAGIAAALAGIWFNIQNWYGVGDLYFFATTQKFSILSFMKNVALFYFVITVFRNHEFSKIGKAVLRKWSDYTLLIYLVHYLILRILYNNVMFYDTGMSPWIGVWVYALIAYFVGGLFALVFHLMWDPIKKAFSKK